MMAKRKETEMKLKIDWKTLGRMIWDAVKPVLLAAIGGGVVSLTGGCSSLQPATKSQSMKYPPSEASRAAMP